MDNNDRPSAKKQLNGSTKQVRNRVSTVRVLFFVIAGLSLLSVGLTYINLARRDHLEYLTAEDYIWAFGIPAGIALIYLLLGILFKRNPFGYILVGLVLYSLALIIEFIQYLNSLVIEGGASSGFGWLIKIAILIGIINGLIASRKFQGFRKNSESQMNSLDSEMIKRD